MEYKRELFAPPVKTFHGRRERWENRQSGRSEELKGETRVRRGGEVMERS